ncbi:hypothetical protein OH76DRAFT_1396871 [Lentinus brumalis]|uniref:C2H2-type domain-containing protein n=1 Tax=Lentinus brumalis TaxID=2498619 RepID=A0A371DSK8_9APHY|nr:hypothetical protein OH76DRAFT_1396871 [Polyporus brumalis]
MPPRHSDFHLGTVGRHPSSNFDQCPSNGPMWRPYRFPPLDTHSPQSDSSFSPPTPVRCITPPHTGSLLEKHAIASYAAKKTQLPLSVYELPTATYMWARWTPQDERRLREPVLYVKYRPPQSDVDSTSGCSRPPSRSSSQTYSSQASSASTPPRSYCSRKRCSSAESDDDCAASPSDRFLKRPRLSHNNAPRRVISARSASPPTLPESPSYRLRPVQSAEASVSHRFGVESDYSDVEMRPARNPHPGHQSNSSSGGGANLARSMAPAAAPAFAALRADRVDDRKSTEWAKYTHPCPATSTGTDFECTWEINEGDGITRRCGYSSKKHLVKRHIESKHLQLRPCVCKHCGKGFAQKSNLDTHLNTHTGDAPHKCIYCDEYFKDPARRHRHMIQMHSHQSSRTKKNRMPFHNDGGVASSAETSEPDAEDLTTEH